MAKPSLIEGLEAEITEEQAREVIEQFHTPKLDAFRRAAPTLKTSHLFGWISNPEQLAGDLTELGDGKEQVQSVIMAAIVAICDEIDRRLPVPK